MLELCPGFQPFRPGFAIGAIDRLRSGTATLGCSPLSIGFGAELKTDSCRALGFTMSRFHSHIGTNRSVMRNIAFASPLESRLAQNEGWGSASITAGLQERLDLSPAESYRCT